MKIGIVGSEAAKFTPRTEARARELISALIIKQKADVVVSGACHLGGVDTYAVEEARKLHIVPHEFAPQQLNWLYGYMPRNKLIAQNSDAVYCFTVKEYPEGYVGMRFMRCYHCGTRAHIKSGGCWTAKLARSMGKPGIVIVIG